MQVAKSFVKDMRLNFAGPNVIKCLLPAGARQGRKVQTIGRWRPASIFTVCQQRLISSACGKHGAEVRPDFNWNKQPVAMMGYR